LGFALVTFGCATSKLVSGKNQVNAPDRTAFIGTWNYEGVYEGGDEYDGVNVHVQYVISADTVRYEFSKGDIDVSFTMSNITWTPESDPYSALYPDFRKSDPNKELFVDYQAGYIIEGTITANSIYNGKTWPEGIGEIRRVPIAMHKTDSQNALISLDFCAKQFSDVNIGLKAEAVQEGICVTFENIPLETTRLFISFSKGLIHAPPDNPHDEIISFAGITDDSLEQVKKTRRIVFPIVQSDEIYRIFVSLTKEGFQPIEGIPRYTTTECIAKNGIYFDSNIELKLDDTHTSVTLSSEPIFSSEVIFDTHKYDFRAHIILKQTEAEIESMSVGTGRNSVTGLVWAFEPELTNSLKEENILESRVYPAFITANCNIIYDNITWNVEIAKTPEFFFPL
jgi:hypothetical protein